MFFGRRITTSVPIQTPPLPVWRSNRDASGRMRGHKTFHFRRTQYIKGWPHGSLLAYRELLLTVLGVLCFDGKLFFASVPRLKNI